MYQRPGRKVVEQCAYQVDLEMDTKRDTVDNVSLHAVENLARNLNSGDDRAETFVEEDDIRSRPRSIGSTLDSDTTVGFLEGRRVVDTVTGHSRQVTTLLQHRDDLVLVLREDFRETVGALDEVADLRARHATSNETLRVVDVRTEAELLAGLDGDRDRVTSQHLDTDTELHGFVDSLPTAQSGLCLTQTEDTHGSRISTRRVEHAEHTEQLPGFALLFASDTERTETTLSKLRSLCTVGGHRLLIEVVQAQNTISAYQLVIAQWDWKRTRTRWEHPLRRCTSFRPSQPQP